MKNKSYGLTYSQKDGALGTAFFSKQANNINHLAFYITINSNPNIEALKQSFNYLLKEHDALRLKYFFSLKGIRQYISEYKHYDIPVIHVENEKDLYDLMYKEKYIDFPLFNRPLYKAIIYTHGNKATLFICVHHMNFDGYSMILTNKYIPEYYEKFSKGEEPKHIENKYSIQKYIEEEHELVCSPQHKEDRKFIKNMINNRKDFSVIIPIAKSKSIVNNLSVTINGDRYSKLVELSKKMLIPVSSIVTSTIALAIYEYTGKNDFCFMNDIHGREAYIQKKTIGNMISTFLNFYHIYDDESVDSFFKESYINYLECLKHKKVSVFEIILSTIKTGLRILRVNYFGIVVSAINYPKSHQSDDYGFGIVEHKHQPNQFYCTISDDGANSIDLYVLYQSKVVSKESMQTIANKFNRILDAAIEDSGRKVSSIIMK